MVQQKRIHNVRFLRWWKEEGQEGTLELWLPRREWCQAGRVDSCLLHWWGVGCCKGGTGGGWEVAVVESDLLQRWRVGCCRDGEWIAAVVEGVLPQQWRWVAAAVDVGCRSGGGGLLQLWGMDCCSGGEVDLSTIKAVEGMWRRKSGGLMSG